VPDLLGLSVFNAVEAAVGRSTGIERAIRSNADGEDLGLLRGPYDGCFAAGVNAKDFALVSG